MKYERFSLHKANWSLFETVTNTELTKMNTELWKIANGIDTSEANIVLREDLNSLVSKLNSSTHEASKRCFKIRDTSLILCPWRDKELDKTKNELYNIKRELKRSKSSILKAIQIQKIMKKYRLQWQKYYMEQQAPISSNTPILPNRERFRKFHCFIRRHQLPNSVLPHRGRTIQTVPAPFLNYRRPHVRLLRPTRRNSYACPLPLPTLP